MRKLNRFGAKRKLIFAVLAMAIALLALVFARFSRPINPVILVSPLKLPSGFDKDGNPFFPAVHFRFENRRPLSYRLLQKVSVAYTEGWHFTVLTNAGAGNFVTAFKPIPWNFGSPDGGANFEFFLRDARLLECVWKVQISRIGEHQLMGGLPARFGTTPAEIWMSEVIPAAPGNWKEVLELQQLNPIIFIPRSNGESPNITTNDSLFGSELRFKYGKPLNQ